MFTWTCSSASNEMGVTPVRSPGWPARPNELLKYDPSIVMLFSRLSCPANENPNDIGLYCGVSRSRSSTLRLIVGRCASCCVETVVAAPVRWLLKMEPAADVSIVTGSSCTLACAGGDALSQRRAHHEHRKDRRGHEGAARANDPVHGWTSPWKERTQVADAHRDREKVFPIRNRVKDAR